MDYRPGDLPDKIPTTIWVWWDSLGEYMETTADPAEGERWMTLAADGCGYAAKYSLKSTSGE